MGSTVSVLKSSKVSGLVVRKKKVHDNGENSKRGAETRNENGAYSLTLWKDIPRTKDLVRKMMAEGIIQSETNIKAGYAELRVLLDDPMGQNFLGRFAQRAKTIESLLAWADIQEYNKIPAVDYQKGKAMQIYEKYVREDAPFEIGGVKPEWRKHIKEKIECATYSGRRNGIGSIYSDETEIQFEQQQQLLQQPPKQLSHLFYDIQHEIFKDIYQNTYIKFRGTPQYTEMKHQIKDAYNKMNR